ncbi:LSM domain-containing protein [Paenibacillus durus]|uniref:Cellobiose phosphorylase n=1 Tax=Paenibacillus durus ATCC 35681 TaxID=1333534 RepID=A0A0F7CHZ8_PAEDU|nr:LSM domain-containing protein [Paenibacillus durus]AKG34916.1 cellobiose phosphorylase [Paenibacillus durus ATCC 35681]
MEAYYNCMRCKGRKVRVLTRDGREYRGVIKDVDRHCVYLEPERGCVRTSSYPYGYGYGYGFSSSDIITLSLFTLLAIALI